MIGSVSMPGLERNEYLSAAVLSGFLEKFSCQSNRYVTISLVTVEMRNRFPPFSIRLPVWSKSGICLETFKIDLLM